MDTFGTFIPESTGIFEFMKALPRFAAVRGIRFSTPSEVCSQLKPVGELTIPYPLSDIDEARDVSAWKGTNCRTRPSRNSTPWRSASASATTAD